MINLCDKIGVPASLEGLAEEFNEAAHAALKASRAIRNENPTPKSSYEALTDLVNEFTDVIFYANELGLEANTALLKEKQERFLKRWEEHGQD